MFRTAKWASLAVLGVVLAACGPVDPATTSTAPPETPPPETQATAPRVLQSLSLPSSFSRQLASTGTTVFSAGAVGSGALEFPEFPPGLAGTAAGNARMAAPAGPVTNRSLSPRLRGRGVTDSEAKKPKSSPVLTVSFDGLNLRDQRTANGGNQFSVEPPDQALCVGNGYVLESVNDVLRVYSTSGQPRTGVIDLNTFYHYPAAFDRAKRVFGPVVTDPVCYYDASTERWFHAVLTLDTKPVSGAFLGSNHLDLAVSQTADPTGRWNLYSLPVQNDGTQGTPLHPNCPCIGDYPHIGADASGIYLTTIEYPFFSDGFNGAQIYAISKEALADRDLSPTVTQFDLSDSSVPAFTLWPAISPGEQSDRAAGGTEYFLSSLAAEEARGSGQSSQLAVWALSNSRSLDSSAPQLRLNASVITVRPYSVPPLSAQKEGPAPLRDCLNDAPCSTFLLGAPNPTKEVLAPLDSSDSRVLTLTYANGKLWGALGTSVSDQGTDRAGIAWYILNPQSTPNAVSARISSQGYLSVPGNNVSFPTIAVTNSGRGVMGFTLVGPDHFPSAAYASIDARAGVGEVQVASAGKGPQDGFSGYSAFADGSAPRPRWGDYGAAATDGRTIWIANEYIAQTCTLAQYTTAPFGSCGGIRVTLGNWGTRISALNP